MQECLDRLDAAGVVCRPYFVTVETTSYLPDLPEPSGCVVRMLGPEDVPRIVATDLRRRTPESVARQLREMRCYAVFHGDALAGYTWSRFTTVPVPGAGAALFDLAADEAYLTDMYIAPEYRGARLAPWLRARVLRALAEEGRTTCYSISLAFNRSARRFKKRLGAQERELRLYLQLRVGPLRGIDLRLARWGGALRSPPWRSTPGGPRRTGHG
jgi:GNAT superfamily N-acetyltransferase